MTDPVPNESASVVSRTVKGLFLAAAIIGLLLLDNYVKADSLPPGMRRIWSGAKLLENGLVLIVPVIILMTIALTEYSSVMSKIGAGTSSLFLTITGVVLLLSAWTGFAYQYGSYEACPAFLHQPAFNVIIIMCISIMGLFSWYSLKGEINHSMLSVAATGLGLIYIVLPFVFLTAIRVRWGTGTLFMALAVCKFTDVGAYYSGKLIGGAKMSPKVSPNKTWAGMIGGICAAVFSSLILHHFFAEDLGLFSVFVFGTTVALLAIVGDLSASLLKREAGIKDYGSLVKGYGGVLDMVDDVLFIGPGAYLFFALTSSL